MSTVKNMKKANKNKNSDTIALSVQVKREIAEEFQSRAEAAESDVSKELRKLIRGYLERKAA